MPLPTPAIRPLATISALGPIEKWVLIVSIGIVLICVVWLLVWHLVAHFTGKLLKKPRIARRQSPEPPDASWLSGPLPMGRDAAQVPSTPDDPERLQQACTSLEDSLIENYFELAESWSRRGHPLKAAAALKRILQICPTRPEAQVAQERLENIGKEIQDEKPGR